MLIRPRPNQVAALTDLLAAFAIHDRVKLIMACGTGKTLVSRWHAEASDARTVLVLVPSLALLAQTLREWRRDHAWPFDALVVCSDPTTAAGAAERSGHDIASTEWNEAKATVTTDPAIAHSFLTQPNDDGHARVVFSTYHSSPVVAQAQATSQAVFDLAICDEAHRLAGAPRQEFRTVLDSRQIVARRRLFMTATQRFATADGEVSMDDPHLFGPVAHSVSFGEAIAAGLLCDYRVMVLGIPGEGSFDDPTSGGPAALLDVIDRHQVNKILTFHSLVVKAAAFARTINNVTTPSGRHVKARHLSGQMPTSQRTAGLTWLATPADQEVRVISNARVLNEGVDVPAVDGVCFVDPRSSVIDVIQAVGRVLRPHPGKTIGTVIVPIGLGDAGDDDTELLASRFGLLWSVLRALRAHDERFATELNLATRATVQHRENAYHPPRIDYVLPDWCAEDRLRMRVVQQIGDAWEVHYATVQAWARENPDRRLPRMARRQGVAIGEWAAKQRTAHAAGLLPVDRARRLEQIPGWYWDRTATAWDDTLRLLQRLAEDRGTIADNPVEPSAFHETLSIGPNRQYLDEWMAKQRQQYRAGTLDPARIELLETLPGWTWTPVPIEDLQMIDALAQYCRAEGHAQVPEDHIEAWLPLGRWVRRIRRQKLLGLLPPALEAEIWAATPSRWAGGVDTCWQWDKPETQWRLAYAALRAFTHREGHASPPGRHIETLPDTTVRLGQWVALQRHQHSKQNLSPARVAALEALPGWLWEGKGRALEPQPPIELPAHLKHGDAGAISRGCLCTRCLEARRESSRRSKTKDRASRIANPVPAARAHRHLMALEDRLRPMLAAGDTRRETLGLGRNLIAHCAGVPLGIVRAAATNPNATIDREHELRLLAVTYTICMSNVRRSGSRGRPLQPGTTRIPAGPTLALIQELEGRGFSRGWIGRELGYANGIQINAAGSCTQAFATRIAQLHEQITALDLRAPQLPSNVRAPSLASLKAAS